MLYVRKAAPGSGASKHHVQVLRCSTNLSILYIYIIHIFGQPVCRKSNEVAKRKVDDAEVVGAPSP